MILGIPLIDLNYRNIDGILNGVIAERFPQVLTKDPSAVPPTAGI
jgi:hypothetical protein